MSHNFQGAADAPGSHKRRTILVVDDSEVVLSETSEILRRAGYRVLTRNGPSGCVAMILQEKPDLVLLDVYMPTVSGDTIVKLLVTAAPSSKTILLLFSGMDEDLLRATAKECGAHGYVTKTYNSAVLLRTVNRWLRRPLNNDVPTPPSTNAVRTSGDVKVQGQLKDSANAKAPRLSGPTGGATPERVFSETRATGGVKVSGEVRVTVPESVGEPSAHSPPRASGEVRAARDMTLGAEGDPRVLFVDDDMMALSAYRRQLNKEPIIFEFALSGAEALRRLLSDTPPRLVVADLVMPEPGGAEVLRRAIAHDSSWNRRFIIVTGIALHEANKQLDPRFCGRVFQKPVEVDELSAAIREALNMVPLYAAAGKVRSF